MFGPIQEMWKIIRHEDKRLGEANRLMELGEQSESHAILQQLLRERPHSEALYADVANIYLLGHMYAEARALIERYKAATGKEPANEWSLEEIEAEEREHTRSTEAISRSEAKIFRRMSLKERGHSSNYFTLWPIKEIVINKEGIFLVQRNKKYYYRWGEILAAYTVRKEFWKSYGKGAGAKMIRTLLVLGTAERHFTFDISSNFPDFKNSKILVSELKIHLFIKQGKIKRRKFHSVWLYIIILCFAFIILLYLK